MTVPPFSWIRRRRCDPMKTDRPREERSDESADAKRSRAKLTRRWLLSLGASGAFFLGTNYSSISAAGSRPGPDLHGEDWPVTALAAPAHPPILPGALVLYDDSGPYAPLSRVYGTLAASLASHFGSSRARGISTYTSGHLANYRAAIYIGSNAGQRLPHSFITDVQAGRIPVLWLGGNLDQLAAGATSSPSTTPWTWTPSDHHRVDYVRYKGAQLSRATENSGPLARISVTDPSRATVLATAVRDDGTTVPWAVRSGRLTYVTEVPLDAADVSDDCYLAVCDLLFDLLDPDAPTRHRALLRLEDINPTSDPDRLHQLASSLHRDRVPYSFALYPVHVDPLDARPRRTIKLSARPRLVRTIAYMLQHGGTMILHGYTHQLGNLRNPDTGGSGADFEFFRVHRGKGGELIYDSPVPNDSATWATRRLRAGISEVTKTGLPAPRMLEFPHYGASVIDYGVARRIFDARYDRPQYFSRAWRRGPMSPYMFDQFAPYTVRDGYGSVIVPENLGYIQGPPIPLGGIGSVRAVVSAARANLVVRDGVASFFYHPYLGAAGLHSIIAEMRDLGYEFVSPGQL